jgi:hypothetical protein
MISNLINKYQKKYISILDEKLKDNKIDNIIYSIINNYIKNNKFITAKIELRKFEKQFLFDKKKQEEMLYNFKKEREVKEKNTYFFELGKKYANYQYILNDGMPLASQNNNENGGIKNSYTTPLAYGLNQRGVDILGTGFDAFQTNSLFYKYADNFLISWRPFDIARLVKCNSIVKNVCLAPVEDAFLEYDIICKDERINADDIDVIKKEYKNLHNKIVDAIFRAKLYGGSSLVFYGDSHNDLMENLDYKENQQIRAKVYDKWFLNTGNKNVNLQEIQKELENLDTNNQKEILKQYELKEIFKEKYFYIEGNRINKSRILLIKNEASHISNLYSNMLLGFGFSDFEDKRNALYKFLRAVDSINDFIKQKRFFALKTPDFFNKISLATKEEKEAYNSMNTFFSNQLNNNDLLNIDATQDIQQVTDNTDTSILFDSAVSIFAMEVQMPKSRLIGDDNNGSLVGGSAGDNENERIYRRKLVNLQAQYIELFNVCLSLLSNHLFQTDYNFQITFEKKKNMTAEQNETYKNNKINNLIQLKTAGVLSSEDLIDNINNDTLLGVKINNNSLEKDLLDTNE